MAAALPTRTPFSYDAGITWATMQADWYPGLSREEMIADSQARLNVVLQTFKLVRTYAFLTPGWEQTGDLDPAAAALVNLVPDYPEAEFVIATSNHFAFFEDPANVATWVESLRNHFGAHIGQVKCILMGNEVNTAPGFTADILSKIQGNFVTALGTAAIPVTCSFNLLPDSGTSSPLDTYVEAILKNWQPGWNGNQPFVFVDPYPDNNIFKNAAGIFDYQGRVTARYAGLGKKVQIFIAETGGEGCADDNCTDTTVNSVFKELTAQRNAHGITVPTFFCEAINEGLKPASPNQRFMGLFDTSSQAGQGTDTSLRPGCGTPSWVSAKRS